jgi:hypothetical protein
MLNDITGHAALIERLMVAATACKSLIIAGPNGVGKTSAVHQLGSLMGRNVETFLGPAISPETFGMNVPSKGFDQYRYVFNNRFMDAPENTIFLIDEYSFMPPTIQALTGELTANKTINGKPLPKGSMIVLTANRVGDTAGVHPVSRLINTRCPTITYYGPTEAEYIGDDKTAGYMRTHGHPAVVTALSYNPEMIHFLKGAYPAVEQKADKLPTHRGWVECSAELKAAELLLAAGKIKSLNRMGIIASHVGDKAAAKCEAIIRLWQELPDFGKIEVSELGTMAIPKNAIVRSLIVSQVVDLAREPVVERLSPFIGRFPAEEQKVMWTQLIAKSTHFSSTNAFQKFSSSVGQYLNH